MAEHISQIQGPACLEWKGKLADAAGKGALFSLYLAMHVSGAEGSISIASDDSGAVQDSEFPARLNHYRRAPLEASDHSANLVRPISDAINSHAFAAARLWGAMHPDPISLRNDALHISEEVVANASLAARNRLKKAVNEPLSQDQTMLGDLIEEAEQYLSA